MQSFATFFYARNFSIPIAYDFQAAAEARNRSGPAQGASARPAAVPVPARGRAPPLPGLCRSPAPARALTRGRPLGPLPAAARPPPPLHTPQCHVCGGPRAGRACALRAGEAAPGGWAVPSRGGGERWPGGVAPGHTLLFAPGDASHSKRESSLQSCGTDAFSPRYVLEKQTRGTKTSEITRTQPMTERHHVRRTTSLSATSSLS